MSISQIIKIEEYKPDIPTLQEVLDNSFDSVVIHKQEDEPVYYWQLKDTVNNYKPLILQPDQVFNVYVGLKRGEACEKDLEECKAVAEVMNNIVQDLSRDIKIAAAEADRLNSEIAGKNQELVDKSVQIQSLKDKKIPWYRHPITIAIFGFAAGMYIAK